MIFGERSELALPANEVSRPLRRAKRAAPTEARSAEAPTAMSEVSAAPTASVSEPALTAWCEGSTRPLPRWAK